MNLLQCISGAPYQDIVLVFFYYSSRWAVSIEEPTFQERPNVAQLFFGSWATFLGFPEQLSKKSRSLKDLVSQRQWPHRDRGGPDAGSLRNQTHE